jgi:triacylglycerol lipase
MKRFPLVFASICFFALLNLSATAVSAAGMLQKESGRDPVVLVHGYCGSVLGQLSVEGYWSFIGTRLALDGYDVYKVVLPDGALADVRISAQVVKEFIDGVLSKTGKSKVDIISHSEGGLVSRYYIKNLGGIDKVDDLVFLSTPNRGTTTATIGPGEAARQMEVRSSFLGELDSDPYLPGAIDYTAFVSPEDEIVLPGKNGFLKDAVNINVNLLGHAGILFNEAVYEMARTAISYDVAENHDAIPIRIVKTRMTTNNPNVMIEIKKFNHYHPDSDMKQMKVSNNPFLLDADWHSFESSKSWRIDTSGEGLKAVYVQFRESGNFFFPNESPTYVDYIFYDTTAPQVSVDVIPVTTMERSVSVKIGASDNSDNYKDFKVWNALVAYGIEDLGVKEMMVSANPDFSGASWQPYAGETTVDLGAGSGLRTVYVKVRDGAGNESAARTDTVRVIDPNSGDVGMISESEKQPVVLVHGHSGSILGDASVAVYWSYIKANLVNDGFDVYLITLGNAAMQDIKISAGELQTFVDGVLAKTGASKVDVVCHSEGGLVARYYIKNLGGAAKVDDLVTISTPHRGTSMAHLAMGLLGEGTSQMEVASPFIQELNSGETLTGDVEYTSLFSHGDEVVVPGKNGFFDGAVNVNFVFLEHAGILFTPDPYKVIRGAISNRYLFPKGVRPIEIKETGMSTKSGSVEVALKSLNHYAPQSPVTQMMVSTDPLFAGAEWRPRASSVRLDISGEPEGLLGVYVKYRGEDGIESPSYPDYIVIDRTPPAGGVTIKSTDPENSKVAIEIAVSDNAEKYGYFNVTNALEAYGILGIGAKEMMLSNSADFAGASWTPVVAALDWNVTPGTGSKTIYAKFRDAAGNESAPTSASAYMFDRVNGYMAQEKDRDPVVFVHGYGGSIVGDISSYINWVYYVERLKAEGYSTHVITLDDAAMQDITTSADQLNQFVQKVLAETGAEKVDLVCHSEGGLVARYFVQKLGGRANVDDLITISTPHRGLAVASITPGEASRQMEIGSDFLQLLNNNNPTPGVVDYTAIFSNDDGMVYPAENAFYEGALNINTNNYTHATILFNDEVYQFVKNALSLDIGHENAELPVYIAKDKMVTASPNVSLSLNYYNHNAPMYPPGDMMISNDKLMSGGVWLPVAKSTNWTLDGEDGLKAVYVKYRAKDSGVESPAYVDYIVLDRTPPSGSLLINPIDNEKDKVELIVTALDNSDAFASINPLHLDRSYGIMGIGAKEMMVWNSPDFGGAVWETIVSKKDWALVPGEGERRVYIKFRDEAGNVSDTVSALVSPAPDETKPGPGEEPVVEEPANITTNLTFDSGWNLAYIPPDLPEAIRNQISGLIDPETTIVNIGDESVLPSLRDFKGTGGIALWIDLKNGFERQITFEAAGSAAAQAAASRKRAIMLEQGWNVVGLSVYEQVAVSDLTVTLGGETISLDDAVKQGLLGGQPFGYSGDKYIVANALLPFRAYFLWAGRPCLLNIP